MENVEQLAVNTIKGLGMDAVQKANSGHPGMVMGMADIATVLWKEHLKYDPSAPDWPDRDRVILSNGHGSMLLYSMLHLTGTSLSLEDLKNFRQWGAPTAGHPEYGYAPGIETTTGPLGQGFANGVGMAMAERWMAAQFGSDLVDHYTYVLCGDGCLMEGISAEAASIAGHLALSKLIVLYDDNQITIDGETDITFSESVTKRFEAYGWAVDKVDGHDRRAISNAIKSAKLNQKPTLIACRTVIAHSAPTKAGTSQAHGAPLGEEEIAETKRRIGMDPNESFVVPQSVLSFFQSANDERSQIRHAWATRLLSSGKEEQFSQFNDKINVQSIDWPTFDPSQKLATRASSGTVLQAIAASVPQLIGGSADLAGSNKTTIKNSSHLSALDMSGRNIHFGVREHAMAAIANGLSLHGGVRPYCATFLVFHDYMRPSVRLAAIMHQPVIFVYTHDSVYVGEDGPTHQPIEQLMSMRLIPNLHVLRPSDANEVSEAWKYALARHDGPTALVLTRQGLKTVDRNNSNSAANLHRGAYVVYDVENPDVILIATGSEVSLAIESASALSGINIKARVVSMPCWKAFDSQSPSYKSQILPNDIPKVSIEAGVTSGWHAYVGYNGICIGLDRFGASAPGHIVAEKLGLSVENVVAKVKSHLE
ncbi:MAG: transketolase [Myxococcota bacterium]|nr:transketolase [Myxococcota bacterium]